MADKIDKNMIIGGVVAAVVAVGLVIGAVVVKGNNSGDSGDTADTSNVAENNTTDNKETTNDKEKESETSNVDYSVVDTVVEFGDYDTMLELSQSIQNGEMVGQIIQIDGIVSHPMSTYSIVEEDGVGNKIGTEFMIDGASEEVYPSDGDHVIITGEVVEKEPLYYVIKTVPEYIEFVEINEEE